MIVSIIAAMDEGGGIGWQNRLPWHLSTDLKRFKSLTMGHHVILGRRTFESMTRPLPGRTMIVISRQPHYQPAGCLVAHSLEEALEVAAARGEDEAYVIGGSEIFAQALKVADRLYLTLVHTRAAADTFFPPFDRQDWEEIQSSYHPADAYNDYPSTFSILVRKRR